LASQNGTTGISRSESKYQKPSRRNSSRTRPSSGPARRASVSAKAYRAARNSAEAPSVAPTTASAAPAHGPNRKPPVTVITAPPGREKATTST
jgi:hypothetical protein